MVALPEFGGLLSDPGYALAEFFGKKSPAGNHYGRHGTSDLSMLMQCQCRCHTPELRPASHLHQLSVFLGTDPICLAAASTPQSESSQQQLLVFPLGFVFQIFISPPQRSATIVRIRILALAARQNLKAT